MDDLVGRWIAGDSLAAEGIYRTYHHRVKEFVLKLGRRLVDAEDIAQEALVAGLEGIRAGKRPNRLTLWLLGIARHLAAEKSRPALLGLTQVADRRGGSARTAAVRREMADLLDRTLAGLPAGQREVLELRHRGNLSRKEIAERLDLPLEAVHARCERGYARLREALSQHFTTRILASAPRGPVTLSAILDLRPAFREAITTRRLEELSESAAAARLRIPVATLRARLESALEMLKCGPEPDFSRAREEYTRARSGQ